MPYASELNELDKKLIEKENFLTNTENETELPVEVPSTSFSEHLDEEIEFDLAELRTHLQAIISGALPGFYEFQQAGYNLLYPKKVDIEALKVRVNTMQIPILIQPQYKILEQAANAFLDRLSLFRKESDLHHNALEFIKFRLEVNKAGWEDSKCYLYNQALKNGNRLSGYLSGTLDLMLLLNEKVEWQTPWETIRQTNYDLLLNELLPVNADEHNNQFATQTRGNLTGSQPDNIKFNAIVDSVSLDDRIAHEALSAEIDRLSTRLLRGITLTKNYAEKPDETGETSRIKRDIDFLCQVLQSVIHVVQYAGQQIKPETYKPLRHKESRTKIEALKHGLKKKWNTAEQKVQGVKASWRFVSDKFKKNKYRIVHALPGSAVSDSNGGSHNINKAVFQVGIRLLDKIQQTTSDMHKAIQTFRPLQDTVSHYSELDDMLSDMPHNSILDEKLREESDRWRQNAEKSKEQLQQLLKIITTLSDESVKQRFLSSLREELKAVTNPLASNNIIRDFDTQVKATVEGLSDIQKALGQALLCLPDHGKVGGKELDKQIMSWLQQLKGIKDNLKTGITQATGQSINNFTRQGMLARWMAEWSEAEKQRYLDTLSAKERAATEKHYDNVFFEVIQHYLPLLSKESDPQGERLLQRLRLEVDNAAKGNTLYPATMADILAGMKSREQAIRDWSERKLIRGVFLAVCQGGFKLLPNLAALPLRLPIKFAITGAKVAWGVHKGRQGIRGGEGDISDEIAEYAKQNYKTVAIKIVLSLPPGLATTLGIASIVWDVYEGGLKGAGEKIAKHIIGEAPWCALNEVSRTAAKAYTNTLIEAAMTEGQINQVIHSSPLQPQTDVEPLSDAHDSDVDRLRVRVKRAVENTPPPPQWHDNISFDATLQSGNFDQDFCYQTFSDDKKKQTYLYGIKFILLQIQNDGRFSKQTRDNAYLARIGAKILVPVRTKEHKLNNTIFLPDNPDAKSGVIICLDSDIPYYYISENKKTLSFGESILPHKYIQQVFNTADNIFEKIQGYQNQMDIVSISSELAETIKADYNINGKTITNKLLIHRAIAGAHIPEQEITATENKYHLEVTWDNLTPAGYLRSFSRPFSTLSGEMQLISSSIDGETIQETESHVHNAEYIGSWVDATVGTITAFTPQGWIVNTAQAAADIAADLEEGKPLDPLAVAGVVVGSIPVARVSAKIGTFTRIGGVAVEYGVMLGNKAIDLAILGRSIKTAVETGDSLDIYKALLASGMSAENSYRMTKNMSSMLIESKKVEGNFKLSKNLQNVRYELEVPENVESTYQGRSPQDEMPENVQYVAVHTGPSGRGREDFGLTTEHHIKLTKLTRLILDSKYSGARILSFDHKSSTFKASDSFTLAHTDISTKKINKHISRDTLTVSVNDMESKTDKLINILNEFEGGNKEAIYGNLKVIKSAIDNIKEDTSHVGGDIESDIYFLVGKNSSHEDINNHYGLAEIEFSLENNNISISDLIAHPYVVINKYPEFRDYLIDKDIVSRAELDKYNIKNVARYLGSKAIKSEISYYESFPSLKVKTFSFNGVNPITQRLGYKLESISSYFSRKGDANNLDSVDDSYELLTTKNDINPLHEEINTIKAHVRKEFTPVKKITEVTDEKVEASIEKIMKDGGAEIISRNISDGINSSGDEIKKFSLEVISAVDRSYEKVSSVKSLFEHADSHPEIKSALKILLNEATGLNDEVMVDIDSVDISNISDMVYNRCRYNVNSLHNFLSKQKSENYNSFVLFKYHQFESSKPDAYALPYDSKKRILLAMLPENQRHGGLVDTVTHEASHNASYTLDHTYIGNVRSETGSFPSSFDFTSRDSRHFYENDRVSKLSSKYALGLPENAVLNQEQQTLANVLLQNSKLIKADTLLNAAEYNAYMIDVLSRAKIKGSHINLEETSSRSKRSDSEISDERDNIIMLASLKVSLPSGSNIVTRAESIRNEEINSALLRATDIDTQKITLPTGLKELFQTYRIISDESGESKIVRPKKAMDLGLVRLGSAGYKTKGYLTFSLPPKSWIKDVHQIGVVKKIKKGITNITYDLRTDAGNSKCTFFSLRENKNEDIFKLSKYGKDLIVWDNGNESIRKDFFVDLTQTSKIDIIVNRGATSFIDIKIDNQKVYNNMSNAFFKYFFVGIDCENTSKFYREVSVKNMTTEHVNSDVVE